MFNYLFKGVLAAVAVKLLDNYRHLSVQLLEIEAAHSYLHGVRMARISAIGLMQMGLLIGLVCLGALLFHAGLFILLPWTVKAKAAFGLFLGLVYTVSGGLALRAAMNEKAWMEKSGAAALLADAAGHSNKD